MKIDHKQFKPYDRVLVRDVANIWQIDFYSHWNKEKEQHITLAYGDGIVMTDRDILPYEGNEHLLGTDDNPEAKTAKPEFTLSPEEVDVAEVVFNRFLIDRPDLKAFIIEHPSDFNIINNICNRIMKYKYDSTDKRD